MNKLLTGLFCSTLILGSAASFAQTTVVVSPADAQGWFPKSTNTGTGALFDPAPAGNPGGAGALQLNMDGSADQIVEFARIPLVLIEDITAISWVFNSSASSVTQMPTAQVEYWSLTRFGSLVPILPPGYIPGTWESVDGMSLMWWSTEFGFSDQRAFSAWQTELTGIRSNFFKVTMGSTGDTSPATTAYIDNVRLATASADTIWDFEGVAPLPPVPEADVSLTKTLDTAGPYSVGDTIEYTLLVSNAGPEEAVDVLVDDLPTNLTIASVSSTNCSALPCTLATLASSASEAITVMATIDSAGAFDNAAGAASSVTLDPDYTNNGDDTGNGGTADDVAAPTPPPAAAKPVPTMPAYGFALTLLGLLLVGGYRLRASVKH